MFLWSMIWSVDTFLWIMIWLVGLFVVYDLIGGYFFVDYYLIGGYVFVVYDLIGGYFRDYASTIKRPLDLRYEPFTQSIQVIEQRETLETLSSALRTEVRNLEKLVKRMDLVSV